MIQISIITSERYESYVKSLKCMKARLGSSTNLFQPIACILISLFGEDTEESVKIHAYGVLQ